MTGSGAAVAVAIGVRQGMATTVDPGTNDEPPTPGRPDDERTPTWVRIGLVVAVLVALALVAMVLLSVDHGPGRHA